MKPIEFNERVRNVDGGQIVESHMANGDRYWFDFNECSPANGFVQMNTWQDAPYFGVWVNLLEYKIVSYAEGDVFRETYNSREAFVAALWRTFEFYSSGATNSYRTFLDTGMIEWATTRAWSLGLGKMLAPEIH